MSMYDGLPTEVRPDGGWYGKVSRNVATLNAPMYVTLASFGDDHEWGPCRWQSRDDSSLPTAGDEVLVLFDEKRQPWVVAWWPYD